MLTTYDAGVFRNGRFDAAALLALLRARVRGRDPWARLRKARERGARTLRDLSRASHAWMTRVRLEDRLRALHSRLRAASESEVGSLLFFAVLILVTFVI